MSYQFKSVLVTGGAGFIASNILNYWLHQYPNVKFYNIDKLDYSGREDNIDHDPETKTLPLNYTFYKADINNYDFVAHILKSNNIDTVAHFSAQSHVCNSFQESLQYTKDNIMGTHTLIEACRHYGKINKFIHVSTDEVYGESKDDTKFSDNSSTFDPTNPYSATKASAELIVKSYYHSFKFPIIITRSNNVYGPRQYNEKVIPRFITQILANKPCTIHGLGETRRSFLYIDDIVSAFDLILNDGKIGEVYNIGTEDEHSVLDVATELILQIKDRFPNREDFLLVEDRPFNDYRYNIDFTKLSNMGWKQKVKFEEGIAKTIDWYKR
jgi:dTDP-glucose 4,6-dehydratase